ncbi:MAG: hypothetical protein PHR30_16255 [Gallionellaceae bacterium]|nr:hypothetical protein [Gallionellaceae bacterium]
MKKTIALLAIAGAIPQAQASCGSMACEMNPAWDIESLTHDQGLRIDLRYNYSRADILRAGSDKVAPPDPTGSGEEIENKRTLNQSLTADLDYAINRAWSVSVQVPVVSRDHAHTIDSLPPEVEQASYTELGDVRVAGKYRFMAGDHRWGGGVRFGLKLPTGDTGQEMVPGEPMEAGLQPGTGSTDLILGGHLHGAIADSKWGGFAQVQVQTPLAHRSGFEPGHSYGVDLGVYYPFGESVTGLLQVNYLYRARDSGALADPDGHSGGSATYFTPGLSVLVGANMHAYGSVQIPIRQKVNGEQLTAPWSLTLGLGYDF